LREHARPVDGVDRAQLHFFAERHVHEGPFHNVLKRKKGDDDNMERKGNSKKEQLEAVSKSRMDARMHGKEMAQATK